MKKEKVYRYEMVTRADDFLSRHVTLLPQHTAAVEVLQSLRSTRVALTEFLGAQFTANVTISDCVEARIEARQGLTTRMDAISQTATAIGVNGFVIAAKIKDRDLISLGRDFAERAASLKEKFFLYGMSAEFMENLKAAISRLEDAILEHGNAKTARKNVIQKFDETLDRALNLVQGVHALVINRLANDSSVMNAWNAARRIESSHRRKSNAPDPSQTSTAAVSTA